MEIKQVVQLLQGVSNIVVESNEEDEIRELYQWMKDTAGVENQGKLANDGGWHMICKQIIETSISLDPETLRVKASKPFGKSGTATSKLYATLACTDAVAVAFKLRFMGDQS